MAEKILIITPIPLFPGHAGNRERIRAICSELIHQGFELDLFYTGFDREIAEEHRSFFNGKILSHRLDSDKVQWRVHPIKRIRELLQGLQIKAKKLLRLLRDGENSAKFNRSLTEYRNFGKQILLKKQVRAGSYKAVIVNYAPYSFYFDLFDNKTVKIIDTHDRLTDRYKLYSESNSTPVDWHSLRKKDEAKALSKADTIWAITPEEQTYFNELVSEKPVQVYTLRHLLPYQPIKSKEEKNRLLMIGSANRLNIDGLTWFLEQVWKKVVHYSFDLQFMIAGSICEAVDSSILDENIKLYGRFDSQDEIYTKGDLFINPMREGTGLKIKTFEALARGKIVLSTKAGATGLDELKGNGLICSDDPATWIHEIRSFFEESSKKENHVTKAEILIKKIYQDNLEVLRRSLEIK